jgi:hypothetical protein
MHCVAALNIQLPAFFCRKSSSNVLLKNAASIAIIDPISLLLDNTDRLNLNMIWITKATLILRQNHECLLR